MLSLKKVFFLFFFLCAFVLPAQEICDNGLDDDGDGLIDLNDTLDCGCEFISVVESLFPNPSFDEFSNDPECASNQANGAPDGPGQANCIAGWQQASEATTDAWHLLTYNGNPPNWPGAIPQPIPSGVAVAGFFTAVESIQGYREYFGACLPEGPTEIGEEYRLNIQLGFGEETTNGFDELVSSPETIELAIYGILDCDNIPFASNQCPEVAGAVGWELITTFTVTAAAVPGWEDVVVDFTTDENYAALAFGGTCDPVAIPPEFFLFRHYYFVDDIILNTVEEFENTLTVGGISVEGDDICSDDARMFVQPFVGPDVTYQWYRNGVAILGATGLEYFPPLDENFNGTYTCRISTLDGCGVAGPVELIRPVVTNAFQDSVYFCDGFVEIIPNVTGNVVQSYLWDDGSTEPNRFVTEEGTYSVTVTSFCEETVEMIVVTDEVEPSFEWVVEPDIFCLGDTITTYLLTDWQLQLFVFGLPNGNLLTIGDTATFILNDPVFLQLTEFGFSCFLFEDQDVFLDPSGPNFAVQDGLLDCSGDPFIAAVTGVSFDPDLYDFEWRDEAGNLIATTDTVELEEVGNYSLTLLPTDGGECTFSADFSISIDPNDLLVNSAEVPTLDCSATPGTLSVSLEDPINTQSIWTFEEEVLAIDTSELTVSEAGEYQLTVFVVDVDDPLDTICQQQYTYTVVLDETDLLVQGASVPELSCENPTGTLSVDLTDPTVTALIWSFDGNVLPTNDTDLTVELNGVYSLEAISLSIAGDTLCRQQYSYEVLFSPADLLVTSAEVPVLDCSTREVLISVELSDPDETNLIWSSANGEQLATNVSELSVDQSGDYQLSAFLLDDSGDTLCRQEYDYTVIFVETEVPVDLQTTVDDGCEGTYRADLIRTAELEGWTTSWFQNDSLIPFTTEVDSLLGLTAGEYSLTLNREDGLCSQTVAFELADVALLALEGEILNLECPTPDRPVQSGGVMSMPVNGIAPYQFFLLDDQGEQLDSNLTGIFVDLPEGDYQLEVSDQAGCSARSSETLNIRFPELLIVEAGVDEIVKLGESTTLRAQTAGPAVDTIIWSPAVGLSCTDCLNPTVTPIENNVYTVTLISSEGNCPATDSVFVGVDATGQVYVPNAFSPNGDGVNDDFRFFPDQSYAELLEFRVYNRWGGEVFVGDKELSARTRWDGRAGNGKPCDSGVYVYLLRVSLLNGEERKLTGAVNLLR